MAKWDLFGRLWHRSRDAAVVQGDWNIGKDSVDKHHLAYLRSLNKERKQADSGADLPLENLEVVVVDIETTGFYPDHGDAIISIGAVAMKGDKLLLGDSFYTLVNPGRSIPPHVKSLTGISDDMVATAPDLLLAMSRFFRFVGDRPLVAHHSRHEREFFRAGLWKTSRRPLTHRMLDTMLLIRLLSKPIGNGSLDALCELHDIPISRRHHAYCDAVAAGTLWGKYLLKAQAAGYTNLRQVYEALR
ncbi:exonuclease domain-containing protein [Brevibacillus brevis]|uniref:Exonuclease domain-containing protein n=1 Tax=Brevibacillus brevis TaxID=1393 RepID=A0ABY9T781_BREBE|nr:exonuclease domain-containing protein [Brevibacillus brevis]WNC15754.1 exonuclease domain-containing protein [Brevibacillus brevis]